ncbi:DmsC/YnfH family molybdoenzyme membrane anchor subunit [Senegalimassilia anaerobia]|uniref:DMSO reductase n=1 Tax=Senegalimassilia anaerobia TaxID=1473216 RepID=A0A369L9Y4_9ACTN|nr:DmsC/YnfH family molybdoenzyme membrane anchor subunit [Senegalimassilia anaerobia]RDB55016.1 hypothetical protein C1880_07230 [Senegalimassilia anaerobia]
MISEFSLFIFTLLGGMAAGTYMATPFFAERNWTNRRALALPLTCLFLIAVGGVALLVHLGHPERMLNAFSNPTAGIAIEGYATMFFGLMVVIDAGFILKKGSSTPLVRALCAIGGLAVSCAMAYAYYSYTSVAAWHSLATLPLFIIGNLACGLALYNFFSKDGLRNMTFRWAMAATSLLLAGSLFALAVLFGVLNNDCDLIAIGILLVLAGAVIAMLADRLPQERTAAFSVAICIIVGLALARYAFYAVI